MTQTWQTLARQLPIGSKRKVECCSTDRSALVSNNHKGVAYYCFRCGNKDFEHHGPRSIAEIMATRQAEDRLAGQSIPRMPTDAVAIAEGPIQGVVWLLKGGITPEEATDKWGMRWHEKTRRVLIPIPNGLLGRAIFGERPKYRMFTNKPEALYWPQKRPHSPVVVVEDILSAIAIDRAGWAAVAVLGTSITHVQAAEIADGRELVVGWFDGDAAGDRAFVKLRKRLMPHLVDLKRVRTERDPKRLHRAAIQSKLTQITGT